MRMNKKGKVGGLAIFWTVLGVLFVGGVLFYLFSGGIKSQEVLGPSGEAGDTGDIGPLSKVLCKSPGGGNTNSVLVNFRNGLNIAQEYPQLTTGLVAKWSTGEASGTQSSSGTKSYTTLAVAPCVSGDLYVLSSTAVNGMKVPFDSYPLTSNYDIKGQNGTRVGIEVYNSVYTSISGNSGGYTQNTTAQTLGTGGVVTGYLDIKANDTSSSAFGSEEGGGMLAIDIGDLTSFSQNSVFINSGTAGYTVSKVDCPADLVSGDNADVCYYLPQLKSSIGTVRLSYSITADRGDPTNANGDDIIFYFEDKNYFRDTDGVIKLGFKDQSATDIGTSQSSLTFNFA